MKTSDSTTSRYVSARPSYSRGGAKVGWPKDLQKCGVRVSNDIHPEHSKLLFTFCL